MSRTPGRHRHQRSAVSTPGDRSVASVRSNRSVRSTSVRSVASAADSESGVAWNIKGQLAQDIEDQFPLASGGIALLLNQPGQALSRFLTERNKAHGELIYGNRGEEIRDKIQDLAYRWKQKTYEEYDKHVIRRHKVTRNPGKPRVRKAYGDSDDGEGSSISTTGSAYQSSPASATPKKPKATPKTPKTKRPPLANKSASKSASKKSLVGKTITTTSPSNTDPIADLNNSFSTFSVTETSHAGAMNTHTIKVDVDYPERNREVTIIRCDDIEGKDNELYRGYIGFLEFDDRFTDDDPETEHVQISIHSGTLIVVECPALPKSLQTNKDRDVFEKDDWFTPNMIKAMDIRRNKFLKDVDLKTGKHQDRRSQYLYLQFPSDHMLSSKELEGDHDESEVPFELIEDSQQKYWIVFKVVTTHVEGNKAGKTVDSVTKKLSKMALKQRKKTKVPVPDKRESSEEEMSVGSDSNASSSFLKDLEDTLKEDKDDVEEGKKMFDEDKDKKKKKKRDRDKANEPSKDEGCNTYANKNDPELILKSLPRETSAALRRLPARMMEVCLTGYLTVVGMWKS